MIQVWLLFNIIEALIGCVAIYFHVKGFTYEEEPLPHVMIFCGTFFGFTILSVTGTIAILIGGAPPVFIECITNFAAAGFYIFASILSMYYAEIDFHLMYLSDFEEPLHPYFRFCRAQSVIALTAGCFHFLHALLALDALLTKKKYVTEDSSSSDTEDETVGADLKQPIKMYFLSKYIETKLRRYDWFDNLCRRQNPALSLFSFPIRLSKKSADAAGDEPKISSTKSTNQLAVKNAKRTTPSPTSTIVPKYETDSEEERELQTSVLYQESGHSVKNVNEKERSKRSASFSQLSETLETKRGSSTNLKSSTRFALPGSDQLSSTGSTISRQSKHEPGTSILRSSDKSSSALKKDEPSKPSDPRPEETSYTPPAAQTAQLQKSPSFSSNLQNEPAEPATDRKDVGTSTLPYNSSSDSFDSTQNENTTKPKPPPPAPQPPPN